LRPLSETGFRYAVVTVLSSLLPVQTLVGKAVVVERESGSAERFQAGGVFSALSHAAAMLAVGL
jgi:hypothetical protein